MDAVFGGWNFSGISRFETGLPFTVTTNGALVYADFNQYRPDQVGDPNVPDQNRFHWFNPAAFVDPTGVGRQGFVHHNSLRGPGFYQVDLSLGKVFQLTETKSLEFKWENYNATNHVNLVNPDSYIFSDTAGQIFGAGDMRQMQFGLHFRF